MKTEKQIREELKIREKFDKTNYDSYSSKRINATIVNTLKWVLEMPTNIKSHYRKDYLNG